MQTTDSQSPPISSPLTHNPSTRSARGAVFLETLRQHCRQILWWGGGMALMVFFEVIILPNVDFLEAYHKIAQLFPGFYEAFTGQDTSFATTAEGYIAGEFFSWAVLMYAVYAVVAGMNVTLNDETSGRLDVLLSLPLERWRIIIETTLAHGVIIVGMAILAFVGFFVGELIANVLAIDTARMFESSANLIPSTLFVLAFTVFISTLFRRRTVVAWLSTMLIVGSFFIEVIGRMTTESSFIHSLRAFSFYHYYDPANVMQYGLNWGNVAILLGASILLVGVAVFMFERRDVNV